MSSLGARAGRSTYEPPSTKRTSPDLGRISERPEDRKGSVTHARTLPCPATLPGGLVVERVLGRGAIGVVVSAITPAPHRRVAVKLLSPEWTLDAEQRRRLLREAQAVMRLSSPHVARVIDVNLLEDGSPFVVFEYLQGRSLESMIADGPLSVRDAVRYILDALDALAEAHRLGLVHRDVKPANLFLAERPGKPPIVKVLDFGLVKDIVGHNRGSRLTMSGTSIGTPAYMAPEQLTTGSTVGPQADVWAVAATLFELITGDVPFAAPSIPLMLSRLTQEQAPRLRTVCPDAPRLLEHVIRWCLEKDPKHRPANAEVLERALSRIPY